MAVNKVRRLGSFAPLSAHAYKDDALAEAGEAAELLYYRGLSFAADVLRDGLVTDSQLIRLVGHGMKDARKRAERLVQVGLWTRVDNGYRIRSWLKWNRSVEEIQRLQRKDAGRKASDKSSPFGEDTPPDDSPSGVQADSRWNPNGVHSEGLRVGGGILQPHTHTEPHTTPTPTAEPSPSPSGSDFEAFYAAYPRKVGRKDAERKWQKAIKGGAEPEDVIAAAKRYTESRAGQDPKFTKHPATWLHQGCWMDEPEQPGLRLVSGGYQPWMNPDDHDAYDEELRP